MPAIVSRIKAVTLIAAIGLLLLAGHVFYNRRAFPGFAIISGKRPVTPPQEQIPPPVSEPVTAPATTLLQHDPPCLNLPAADDVLVVMRTGATEIADKLPAHLNSTFRCYSDVIVFSDYGEDFMGFPVHDVLANLDPDWKNRSMDFDLYNRLQKDGREGLQPDELSGSASDEGSKSGKPNNPGWKLDKWKFLPMTQETLKLRPNKKWYVFVETDSYLVWSNLIQWLPTLDATKPWYFGSENQIGKDLFAHGGSVFVLSHPALQKAADLYTEKEVEWNQFTANHWAGDCVLGKVLFETGTKLTWSWPMLQGDHPERMDFSQIKGGNKKMWCTPVLSYHHLDPTETHRMWNFEQRWIQERFQIAADEHRSPWQQDRKDVLHHSDVFRQFIYPNITTEWREWNNLSPDLITADNDNYEACYHLCEDSASCMQFSVGPPGCSISTKAVMLGQRTKDYRSYWVNDRISRWMDSMDQCEGFDDWIKG